MKKPRAPKMPKQPAQPKPPTPASPATAPTQAISTTTAGASPMMIAGYGALSAQMANTQRRSLLGSFRA